MKVEKREVADKTLITLNNGLGLEVTLCTFGASFYDIKTIDKDNNLESVILTPTNFDDFLYTTNYYGKAVGRFSGRIDKAHLMIGNKEYNLEKNWNDVSALHGCSKGISFCNFNYEITEDNDYTNVTFTYLEKADLLPGDLNYHITYKVSKQKNEIRLEFKAKTTELTLCNLTNHAYFNLSGNGKRTVLDEVFELACDCYTRVNNELITLSVDKVNEVMDFRKPHKIKDYINDESLQNHIAKGYDHCFVKENKKDPKVARLEDLENGRILEVTTSYPCIVCYSANYPGDFPFGKDAFKMLKHHAICLECQNIPNGINMQNEEKSLLDVNEEYQEYINYKFDLKKD